MSTLRIDSNADLSTEFSVRESDEYSDAIYVTIARKHALNKISGNNELFLTPTQLDQLGRFFVRKAEEIRVARTMKKHK